MSQRGAGELRGNWMLCVLCYGGCLIVAVILALELLIADMEIEVCYKKAL